MSDSKEPEAAEVEEIDDAGESGEPAGMSERTAKLLLLAVLLLAMWGIIAAAPWVAYVVVGILLDRGWLKARDWRAQRGSSEEEAEPADPPASGAQSVARELAVTLHAIGAPHAHISALAERMNAPADCVREALTEAGIPISGGVRMAGRKVAVSTGVKREDFPPLPSPAQEGPEEGALLQGADQQQQHNNNTASKFPGGMTVISTDDHDNPNRTHVKVIQDNP